MHPYATLEPRAFWAQTVAKSETPFADLWRPKTALPRHAAIATFGSCFAQHVAAALRARGLAWVDGEPAPAGLGPDNCRRFNYGVFSARTGNIYTAAMLHQWARWSLTDEPMPQEIWTHGARFIDPLRPRIEPDGFLDRDELLRARDVTRAAFAAAIAQADVLVFTLGLTEAWVDRVTGTEYPLCPGTAGGRFDPSRHQFVNHGVSDVVRELRAALALLRAANPKLALWLTVSPVPLTATASGAHVLVANTRSKAVLRAAAAEVVEAEANAEYVPSFEIITSHATAGPYHEANRRSVSAAGVEAVMASVFAAMGVPALPIATPANSPRPGEVACEEHLLAAFEPSP